MMAAKFNAIAANYYNLPPIDTDSTVRVKRERRGMCGGCGTKTYSFRRSIVGYKEYIPLTLDGIVPHSRCFYCYRDTEYENYALETMCVAVGTKMTEKKFAWSFNGTNTKLNATK